MSKAEQERASLVNRVRRCRDEINQLFTDAEYWNSRHAPEESIDPDPDGLLVKLRASLQHTLESEEARASAQQATALEEVVGSWKKCTTSGQPPVDPDAPAPNMATKPDGQHEDYWVLCAEERAKGFIRPLRSSYLHVGRRVCGKPRQEREDEFNHEFLCTGTPGHEGECAIWAQITIEQLGRFNRTGMLGGCGTSTRMSTAIAETYARNPKFYGSTFCVACGAHFPVGESGEFVWEGSNERVGT